jgi:hypothetical protein
MPPRFHPAITFFWLCITVVTSSAQPVTTLIPLPAGWRLATEFMADFPREGLQLYVLETAPPATPTKVFCLAWDPTTPTVAFKPVLASTPRTPTQFAAQEPGKVFAALNAGYFGGNQSFSLVQHAGVVASPNVKSLSRTFQGAAVPYFPTRAAFGLTHSGRPTTDWIYSVGTGNTPVIAYPAPSPNRLGVAPQPVPTASSPAGGVPWIMEHALGGSPMLIKDGEIHVTDAEELIEINNTTSRPRSAIGYTASGIVLFVAAEGDNAPGPAGLNLVQFATLLRSLGCVGAVNLDGGGSTSLVIGEQRTVRPSGGNERAVISALLLFEPASKNPATDAPQITHQPWDIPVAIGTTATLQVAATGGGLSYLWSRNGIPIPGATLASYTLAAASAASVGTYTATVSSSLGSVTSRAAAVSVVTSPPGELSSLSTRADSGLGADVLIGGFFLRTASGSVLARGIGPGLMPFGVVGFLPDPHINLLTGAGVSLATNDNWNASSITPVATALGAFALSPGSLDAALVQSVSSGAHSVVASGQGDNPTGNVLIELYNASPAGSGQGVLASLSARARVSAENGALIAGFFIRGQASLTVLIRGIGPALFPFGVSDALPSTRLSLVRDGETRFINTGWASAANALELRAAARQTGAFPLFPGSADSALLVTLAPGAYTAVIESPTGAGGVALVEVYEIR